MTAKSVPDWVNDLLQVWAGGDWGQARRDLGYPSVSPMFRGVADSAEELEVTGYSPLEVRAVQAAVDWLHLVHEPHWRALTRRWRPWLRDSLAASPDDDRLVREAAQMIADYVDKTLG